MPLFFNGSIGKIEIVLQTFFVFCSFCFAASSIYCLNDIRDVENDRKHKTKCKRPIASGAISVKNAVIIMIVLLFLSIFTLFFSKNAVKCAVIILIYYIMNVLYCFGLKNIAILDVILLSFGYVLRLIGGSFAGNIPLSEWIVIMTFLLSMFLALAKRKDDVLIMQKTGIPPRKNTARYSLDFINQILTLTTAITIFCYIMYTVQNEVIERFNTKYLYATSLFVFAGFMRYLQLSFIDQKGGDPVKLAVHDKIIRLILLFWFLSFAAIIYFPRIFH